MHFINQSVTEICDNAIDDDNDSLIDLNDPDCDCAIAEPVSLIPNPSFEKMDCCPGDRGSLHCAETWIQASEATTDYIHTCGWMGWEDLPVPLPLPDGEACIGFRNGRFGQEPNSNWKEYTGACLSTPLKAGTAYRFQFHIGFTNYQNSPPLTVVFYGSTSCDNLPFGIGNQDFGCPTNGPGWTALSSTGASGVNNWTVREFNVTPDEDIYAIAIGPSCFPTSALDNPYYFLDNLILAEVREFEFVIGGENHPCSPEFRLRLPERDSLSYQWYKDGIAILDAKSSNYEPEEDGIYQVRIIGPSSCKVTKSYLHSIPQSVTTLDQHVCEGAEMAFGGQMLSETGTYTDTIKTLEGCDSIIIMNLTRVVDSATLVKAKIVEGESYRVGDQYFGQPMSEEVTLTSRFGCDSTVQLELEYYNIYIPSAFSPNGDGINDKFSIYGSSELRNIKSLRVYDRWGGLVYSEEDINPGEPNEGWDGSGKDGRVLAGPYTYMAMLVTEDGVPHRLSGEVSVLP